MRSCFQRLFGNEKAKNRICECILSRRIPHAFLIDGQDGSGKLTLALSIAAALNCENKDSLSHPLPCGECESCNKIFVSGHTDVKIIGKRDGKATIGVDEVKTLRQDMFLSATEAEYKVYIIENAEVLTPAAQNALLTVLEEPPKNVIIILLSESLDKILTTVRSRTQYIAMERFSNERLDEYLCLNSKEARALKAASAEDYAALLVSSDARIGQALALLNSKEESESRLRRKDTLRFIGALMPPLRFSELYSVMLSLPQKRAELTPALEDILNTLRDLLVLKHSENAELVFFGTRAEALSLSEKIGAKRIAKTFELINSALGELVKNVNVTGLLTSLISKIQSI